MTATHLAAGKRTWLKRAGAIGFWFFLVKGILWMAAPLVFYHLW